MERIQAHNLAKVSMFNLQTACQNSLCLPVEMDPYGKSYLKSPGLGSLFL